MTKNGRKGPKKPATKFANLRKKMPKQKVQVKKPTDLTPSRCTSGNERISRITRSQPVF